MSRAKASALPSGGTPEEAEEFMALLLAAQNTDHVCSWCAYFKKMGDRMVKTHVKETVTQ